MNGWLYFENNTNFKTVFGDENWKVIQQGICTNMLNGKEKLLVIGKVTKPRGFRNT